MVRQFTIMVALFALLALTACNAGPVAPCQVAVSKQAADQFVQRAAQAFTGGKSATLTASNDEVSSLLSLYLDDFKKRNPEDFIPISNAIVCFDSGKADLFGQIEWGKGNPVAALITLSAAASGGKPVFTVSQIQLGPVPVPADLNAQLTRTINRTIAAYLDRITIAEIKLSPGQFSITGQLR
ncbi:MAG: hypothetical protein HZB53_02035 [Chloroflexi bacterium]|nr:hypothetical protein [Chloroflexota bacterium]